MANSFAVLGASREMPHSSTHAAAEASDGKFPSVQSMLTLQGAQKLTQLIEDDAGIHIKPKIFLGTTIALLVGLALFAMARVVLGVCETAVKASRRPKGPPAWVQVLEFFFGSLSSYSGLPTAANISADEQDAPKKGVKQVKRRSKQLEITVESSFEEPFNLFMPVTGDDETVEDLLAAIAMEIEIATGAPCGVDGLVLEAETEAGELVDIVEDDDITTWMNAFLRRVIREEDDEADVKRASKGRTGGKGRGDRAHSGRGWDEEMGATEEVERQMRGGIAKDPRVKGHSRRDSPRQSAREAAAPPPPPPQQQPSAADLKVQKALCTAIKVEPDELCAWAVSEHIWPAHKSPQGTHSLCASATHTCTTHACL